MSVTIPAAVELHTTDTSILARTLLGAPSNPSTKGAGNLPITLAASQWLVNSPSPSTTDQGALFPITSIDVSVNTKILVWSWQFNAPNRIQCRSKANEGISAYIGSGAGTTDYKKFVIGGNDTPAASSQAGPVPFVIDLNDTSHDSSSGTFDNTDVQLYGLAMRRENISGTGTCQPFVQRAHIFGTAKDASDIVKFTGTSDFDDIITAVLGSDYSTKIGTWVQKLSTSFFIPVAFQIGDTATLTNFNDNGATVISPSSNDAGDPRYRLTAQATRVYVNLRNDVADTCILSGTYNWGVASPWDLDVSNNSSITITGATFRGMGDFTVGSSVTGDATFTLASGSNVIINGADIDGSKINGAVNIQGSTVTTFTNLNVTGAMDFDTAGTYTLDGCTISEVTNSSGGNITLTLLNGATVTTNNGPNITLSQPVNITAPNIIDGSRVQIYNVTKSSELDNSVVSGGSGYALAVDLAGATIDDGDTLRLRATYQSGVTAKDEALGTGIVTSNGLVFLTTQDDNTAYNTLGIDGSTITNFSADYVDDEVDIIVTSDFTLSDFYAWWVYNGTLSQGISDFFGGITAVDEANFNIHNAVVNIFLDNTTATNVSQTDNRRLYRDDLSRPVKGITTGGGGVDVEWRSPVSLANSDAIQAILDANLDVAVSTRSSQTSVDSIQTDLDTNLDATISSRATQISVDSIPTSVPTAAQNATAVWDEVL